MFRIALESLYIQVNEVMFIVLVIHTVSSVNERYKELYNSIAIPSSRRSPAPGHRV